MAHRYVGDSVFLQQDKGQIGSDGTDFSMVIPLACWGYALETVRFEHVPMLSPVPVAWWRGTAATTVTVANECFMDEMATLAGVDPLAFRLKHLPPGHVSRAIYGSTQVAVEADLMRRVLVAAADRAGWGQPPAPGWFRGIAAGFYDCDATYTAAVAEVTVGAGGPRIHRLVIASDSGLVLNHGRVEAQLFSNAVFALGSVMGQEITAERGRVRQTGFADFPLPTLADLPIIEPVTLESTRQPSGIGEPATPVITAALVNALSAALGRRVTTLPLKA